MLISLNWLKKFVKINLPNEELIPLIGSRLVEVEGVIDQTHKYDNTFVVRVASCEKIPDTHLSLCQIDAGDFGLEYLKKSNIEPTEYPLVQVFCQVRPWHRSCPKKICWPSGLPQALLCRLPSMRTPHLSSAHAKCAAMSLTAC